jgi:hypothetical protein
MGEIAIEKYRPDMAEALVAFGSDPSYAVAIAKQAGTLLSRREAKRAKDVQSGS